MLFQRTQPLPIGLHVGSNVVRLLQLRRRADGALEIAAAAAVPLALDEKDDVMDRVAASGDAIRAALRRGGFRGRGVVAALPRELVHLRTLRLPPMPDADVPWAVKADARDVFLFDTAKAHIEFIDAGEVRHGGEVGREIIMAAAGEAFIDRFVRDLDSGGCVVRSIDIEPCALHRAVELIAPGAEMDVAAALHVGDARSQIVVSAGGRIRVLRTVDVGARHLNDAVARKLGVSAIEADRLRRRAASPDPTEAPPAESVRRALADAARGPIEAIVREATLALRYHAVAFRGAGPGRLRLMGEETATPQFQAALKEAGAPALDNADLFAGLGAAFLAGSPAEWAVALGLALRPPAMKPPTPASRSIAQADGKEAAHV